MHMNEPIRVVYLLENLEYGGTQSQTLELAKRIDTRRFRSEIWSMTDNVPLLSKAREYGIETAVLGNSRKADARAVKALWKRMRRDKPDLLMLLTVVPNIWGRLIGRLHRPGAVIGNCRGGGAPKRQHERFLKNLVDHHIVNSNALKQLFLERFNLTADRISVIHNGVDTERFFPGPKQAAPNTFNILNVGRLVEDKDQETLIRAFVLLKKTVPQAELTIIGRGPLQEKLQRKVAMEFDAKEAASIHFLEPTDDLLPHYRAADVFALSSVREALPNVVLEAMATGIPVAATDVGGVSEVVEHDVTGLVVPAGDPVGLADALKVLAANELLRTRMGKAGRARVERSFSADSMTFRYEEVFQRLAPQE